MMKVAALGCAELAVGVLSHRGTTVTGAKRTFMVAGPECSDMS